MTEVTAVFDDTNVNWTRDPAINYLFLKSIQQHMNNVLLVRGHVFLNDVFQALGLPSTRLGQTHGWVHNSFRGDNYVDFGFMSLKESSIDPMTLSFNIDGDILDCLPE